jgi:hypothetical protein
MPRVRRRRCTITTPAVHSLLLRASKFHKSRCLPLAPDGVQEI